jgi:hypothetical protein
VDGDLCLSLIGPPSVDCRAKDGRSGAEPPGSTGIPVGGTSQGVGRPLRRPRSPLVHARGYGKPIQRTHHPESAISSRDVQVDFGRRAEERGGRSESASRQAARRGRWAGALKPQMSSWPPPLRRGRQHYRKTLRRKANGIHGKGKHGSTSVLPRSVKGQIKRS